MAENQCPKFTEEQLRITVDVDGCTVTGHFTYIDPGDYCVILDAMRLGTGCHIPYMARGVSSFMGNGQISPRAYERAQGDIARLHELSLIIKNNGKEILERYRVVKAEIEAAPEYADRLAPEGFRALRNPFRTEMRKGAITPKQYEAELKVLQKRLKIHETCEMKIWYKLDTEFTSRYGFDFHYGEAEKIIKIITNEEKKI